MPPITEPMQQRAPIVVASQVGRGVATLSTTEILSHLDVSQMGEKFSIETVNIAEVSGGLSEERRKEIKKNLFEKHTLECAQLESELRTNEIKVFVLDSTDLVVNVI